MRRVNEAVREVVSEGLGDLKTRESASSRSRAWRPRRSATARVFVSVLGSWAKRKRTLTGLAAAHGSCRLGSRELRMKRTPQLAFEYDPTVERGVV